MRGRREKIDVTGRRGRRRKQLLDDLKERIWYCKFKEDALDRTLWRTRFRRGYGPVVRQNTGWVWQTQYSRFQTFAVFLMLYSFFRVIPWRLNFMCKRFGTLCSIFIVGVGRKDWHSIPKRRHIIFRRRGIAQRRNTTNTILFNRLG
jgi:hypothetical protein